MNLINLVDPSQQKSETGYSDKLAMQITDVVFNKLKAIFPAWTNSIKDANQEMDIKKEWMISFQQNSISTKHQIDRGLAEARKSTSAFFPSCGMFVDWCAPPIVNQSHQPVKSISQVRVSKKLQDEINERGMKNLKIALAKQKSTGINPDNILLRYRLLQKVLTDEQVADNWAHINAGTAEQENWKTRNELGMTQPAT